MTVTFPTPVKEAILRLQQAGFEAYAVGGCVRDSLLGKTPHDWDITTSALPTETEAVFNGFRLIETGIQHGTVTVLFEGMPLEITTYRIDGSYTDHRRPDRVAFTSLLAEDLKRRDFTVNAMAAAPNQPIVDLFGGQEDLKNGVIRAVGDADTRFTEDALRILRGLRFASTLGFSIAEDTAAAMLRQKELLRAVSAERIFTELKKLLCGKGMEGILLQFPAVLGVVLPELLPLVGFDQRTPYHLYDIYTHTVKAVAAIAAEPTLRLTMLLHDIGKPDRFTVDEAGQGHFKTHPQKSAEMAEEILRRLKADRATLELVCKLIEYHDAAFPATRATVRRWMNRLGAEEFRLLMAVKIADNRAQNQSYSDRTPEYEQLLAIYRQLLEEDACFQLKDLAVSGREMMALGLSGKQIGEALQFLLESVIEEQCENEAEALLGYLRQHFLQEG